MIDKVGEDWNPSLNSEGECEGPHCSINDHGLGMDEEDEEYFFERDINEDS